MRQMARTRLDRMLVFDIEETCWEGDPPPGERQETIEIGLAEVLLDGTPRIGRTASYDVRPVASRVSAFCTDLTGITPARARRGRHLGEVMSSMQTTFGGIGKTWAAWGRDDACLARDCSLLGLPPPVMGGFLDLGATWAMLRGHAKPPGLRAAMAEMGLEFEGEPHRAGVDAFNTARLAVSFSAWMRALPLPDAAPEPSDGLPRP